MKADHFEIGMCGTFDVENYGDLLFPLIAQAETLATIGLGHSAYILILCQERREMAIFSAVSDGVAAFGR
jgi:hypothetical protein